MSDWIKTAISDLAVTYAGGTPNRAITHYFGGNIAWVKSTELNLNSIKETEETLTDAGLKNSSAKYVPLNTPLIAMYGATAGVVGWLSINATTNQAVLAIVPKTNKCDSRWLYWTLTFNREKVLSCIQGSGQLNLNKGTIDKVILDTPKNIEEQKTIAAILDTLDETVAAAEDLLAKQEKMKQGLLQDLLTRGVNENGQLRPHWDERHDLYQRTELGWIPISWGIGELGDLIATLDSGVSVNSNDRIKRPDEQGILKTSCLNGGVFSASEHKAVLPNEMYRLSTPVKGDSIIISRMNTPLLVGESAYVFEDVDDLYLPDRLWITRMKEKVNTSVRWLSYVLRSPRVRDSISNLATGTSGSMKNIAKGSLLGIRLAIPSPQEQSQIAFMIDSLSKQSEVLDMELKKLRRIKTGLMQDLLTGRRRVTPELIQQVETLTRSAD